MITSVFPRKHSKIFSRSLKTKLCLRILQCVKESLREKVGLARSIVYNTHFFRAGPRFWERVPISPVLGLPIQPVPAWVKFWLGTDGEKSFTQLILSVPNLFFWRAYYFYPGRAKHFLPCKSAFSIPTFWP